MISEILEKHEGKTLEFKENLKSLSGIIKTIIAFANTAGGTIVIGIEDKTKKIIGVDDSLLQEERLSNAINDNICPLLMPDIEIQNYQNKELIIINVPHATGPCYLKSAGIEKGTYVRLGSTNRIADDTALQSLKNFALNIYYDELPYIKGNESDIDWNAVNDLFQKVDKKISNQNAQNLGLLTDSGNKEVPTFGGIILFGKNRLKLFPEAIIRCARFLGTDKENILDRADIEIYLPFAIEQAIKFVQRNTMLSSEIKGLTRRDIPQYPPIALREAIMNAIVHADYSIKGVYISVAIFDDRIEITNPGGLPYGFTIEKALSGASRIRNRVIAKVFYYMNWIEQWGRGIDRIIKECEKHGLERPKFEELNNQFRVTLYSTKKSKTINEPWQKEMVNYLKKKNKINTKKSADLWKVTSRTARLRLIKLLELGIIERTGKSLSDPRSGYILK